jgi:hypothetical protein
MRRVIAGLLIACGAGAAVGQPPRPAPAPTADVFISKSPGQPERRLKLLSTGTGPDGQGFAEVQDAASGVRYTLPTAALAGMRRATAADPAPPPPAKPALGSGGKFPTTMTLPEPPAGSFSPFAARPQPAPQPPPKPRWGESPPRTPTTPPSLETPLTNLVTPVKPAAVPRPDPLPPFALDPPRPSPPPPPVILPPPVAEPPPLVRPAQFVLAPPSVVRVSVPEAMVPVRTADDQLRAETDPFAHDLVHALRPSVRERAATALAGCRHASHPEVKRLLAQTAMTDPAPTVQAHCVRLLSELGYHAADYREFLEASGAADHPGLRQAAAAALARLTPR